MSRIKHVIAAASVLSIFGAPTTAYSQTIFTTNAMQDAGYSVVDKGQNYRTWSRLTFQTNADQTVTSRTNQVIEVGNWIHRWQTNQSGVGVWVPCAPEIVATTNGIVGRGAPHSLLLASNCNSYAAVQLRLPEGQVLKSHLLGLAYYDQASGSNLMFATLTNSTAQIIGTTRVSYPSAFSGVDASIAYSYTRAGFSQEIRFNEMPPDPAEWGLNPATSHLLLITEFVQAPTPSVHTNAWPSGMETMQNQELDFGQMKMTVGFAFRSSTNNRKRGIPTAKQWQTLSGRTVLVERLQWSRVRAEAAGLPAFGSGSTNSSHASINGPVRWFAQGNLPPPPPKDTVAPSDPIKMFAAMPKKDEFIADYDIVSGGSGWYFWGGYTFLITDETWLQYAEFDPGAVVKFSDGASLHLSGTFYYGGL